jgi:predicted transcriptional regulator of viral defense system
MATKYNLLLQSGQNVFNIDNLSVIWGQKKRSDTVQSVRNYVKSGQLFRLRRGLYTLNKDSLDVFEVANKAWTPSYVSGQTILAKHGTTYQSISTVHSISPTSKKIMIEGTIFLFHMVKEEIFYNQLGIENRHGIYFASLERAVADLLYYSGGNWQFENLENVNWEKLKEIALIYGQKILVERVLELEKIYAGY